MHFPIGNFPIEFSNPKLFHIALFLLILRIVADDEDTKNPHVIHFEANGNFDRSWRDEKWGEKALDAEVEEVYVDEKESGPAEALKAYPKL